MNSTAIIDVLKKERINTLTFFRKSNDDIRGAFICTGTGSEINIDSTFLSTYEIKEEWNVRKTNVGCVEHSCDYKIINKNTGDLMHSQ